MGNTQAKNDAKAVVNAGVTITNAVGQKCIQRQADTQVIQCQPTDCPPGVISHCNIDGVDFKNSAVFSTTCLQTATSNTAVNQQVAQQVQQTAAAISAGLGLSNTDADNTVNAAANVSTAIDNSFQQALNETNSNSQEILVTGCQDNVKQIAFDLTSKLNNLGTQNSSIVNSAAQTVTQTIKQKATAVNLGLLLIIVAVIIGVAIVMGEFFKSAGSTAKVVVPLVLIGGGGYVGLAAWQKWWPWKTNKAGPIKLVISPSDSVLPKMTQGTAYKQTFTTAAKAKTPYTWSVVGKASQDALKAIGLTMSSAGVLSGTPTIDLIEPIQFNVYVTDSSKPKNTGTATYTLTSASGSTTPAITGASINTPMYMPLTGDEYLRQTAYERRPVDTRSMPHCCGSL